LASAARQLAVSLAVLAGAGCDKQPDSSGAVKPAAVHQDRVQGTLSLAGKDLALGACTAGYDRGTWVEVATATGALHFETKQLSWAGQVVPCTQLDRRWGGGQRDNGSAFWRGTLLFQCTTPAGPLHGDLTLDCGHTTDAERTELDRHGQNVRETGQP